MRLWLAVIATLGVGVWLVAVGLWSLLGWEAAALFIGGSLIAAALSEVRG